MRRKPHLAERLRRCADIRIEEPAGLRGRWLERHPGYGRLHVELGCGKGRFTAETARGAPDTLLVAIERSPDAMVVAMERCAAAGLRGVRFIGMNASGLPEIFAPGEVSRIYINFCDPWPARRHESRRLTHEGFLGRYRQVLAPGGEIHFKTDSLPLFEYSLKQLERCGFSLSEVTRDLHREGIAGVMTDYEEKFHRQGILINRCVAAMTVPRENGEADI